MTCVTGIRAALFSAASVLTIVPPHILVAVFLLGSIAPAIAGAGGTFGTPDGRFTTTFNVSEGGGHISVTIDKAFNGGGGVAGYSRRSTVEFNTSAVTAGTPEFAANSGAYVLHLECKSEGCFQGSGPDTASNFNFYMFFSTMAEAQQWKAAHFGGSTAGTAASCQQTSSMHYSDGRSANTVKVTVGGAVDGHFYTPDGTVTVVHNSYKDANGLTSWGHTYLEGDNGQIYRLDPGKWQIQPGCYTHRISDASVLGTGSLSSTVFFADKPAPSASPGKITPEQQGRIDKIGVAPGWAAEFDQSRAACRTLAEGQPEPFPNAFDKCMRSKGH